MTTNELMLACDGGTPQRVQVDELVIAGWTGRDSAALEKHIRELEEIGVARPKRTPIFYRVGASLLTTAAEIQVMGAASSGEVEFVLLGLVDGLCVGVGSDHTDRKAETAGVTLAKQLCPKPIGSVLWRYDDVASHWDRLILRSFAQVGGRRRLYQEGSVAAMRSPEELLKLYREERAQQTAGWAMFGGTLAVAGGIEPAQVFEIELEDPVLRRKLSHSYRVTELPVEG